MTAKSGWSERAALIAFGVFTTLAVVGFGVFGTSPGRLAGMSEAALAFYGVSFRVFAVGQVLVAGAAFLFVLWRRARWAWLPAFVLLYAISLTSELLGTGYGIPFGEYRYAAVLAPMWLDRVPAVIPLSWFYMAVASYALAALAYPREGVGRVVLASALLVAWDLALDPAMSYATKYWVWGDAGPYYGMPLLNLFGWYVTGLALMAVLALLKSDRWSNAVPKSWAAWFWGLNLALPLGMCAATGLWGALALTLAVVAVLGEWIRRRARHGGREGADAGVRTTSTSLQAAT